MPDLNERDEKIIQYLVEALSKERELERALESHIDMTTKMPYKKRLRQHLTETRHHATAIEKRVRQIGGDQSRLEDASGVVATAVGVTKAVAKAPIEAIRGTGEQEKMLKNAKSEFAAEQEEIATYKALEAFAEKVGDGETAKLAKQILREEERMAKFLDGQIKTLARSVATDEVPSKLRTSNGRQRTGASRGGRASTSTRSKPSAKRRVASRA
jgi:ferritin-like metal-binding protein YciE